MLALDDKAPKAKSNEWFTPSRYIEAARAVMGGIDLDPASCALANETVKATCYYSKEDDGLSKPWHSRVWLNPPYGRISGQGGTKSYQLYFVERLVREYESGNVSAGILLLLGNSLFKRWFPVLWDYLICFHPDSIAFSRPGRIQPDTDRLGFGSIFVYLGPNEQAFIEHFSAFGRIAKAIDTPKQALATLPLWEVMR